MRRFWEFLKESRKEFQKVSWPEWEDVSRSTYIVFFTVIFFAVFLFLVDILVQNALRLLLE